MSYLNLHYALYYCYNFFISMALFFSVHISPETWDYTGLLPLLIPVFLVLNIFLVVLLLFGRFRLIIYPVLVLIIGWKFLVITFQWNEPDTSTEGFTFLSYNTMLFNNSWGNGNENKITNSIKWAKENPSDIKCFQEFYQDYTTPSRNSLKMISDNGTYEYAYYSANGNEKKKSYGIAILVNTPSSIVVRSLTIKEIMGPCLQILKSIRIPLGCIIPIWSQ